MEMIEATHKASDAHKTWHIQANGWVIGTVDHLPDGKFRSNVENVKRLHPHLQSALVRIFQVVGTSR